MSKRKTAVPSILIGVLCRIGGLVTNAVTFGMVEIAPLYIWQGVSLVFIGTINSGISVGINGLGQQTDNADRQHLCQLMMLSLAACEETGGYLYEDDPNNIIALDEEPGSITVWIPIHGGTKYHTYAGCCNMKDPERTTLANAQRAGFEACKLCH